MRGNICKVLCVAGLITSLSFFTAGCAKKAVDSEAGGETVTESTSTTAPTEETAPAASRDTGETAGSYESLDSGNGMATAGDYNILEGRTHEGMVPIYFDFDKSNIRADQRERIEANAEFMKNNSDLKITIEGNCDERGTNEYNIALGERRAQSAKKYLINLGVPADNLYTVSYGEERPLLYGHDEYSWAQNRRDDFVIQ
ncbi:MAG: peptidoglycan-associated lipoprotein [Desulfobulbaceae bacterium]|nr:MAG: peptidoglycan-associated lipoprotein [Desulfobulbaceae bacterium]